MNSRAKALSQKAHSWLADDVLPLWSLRGVDPLNGGFYESLSEAGEPVLGNRRALVQARQIYAFTEAANMGLMDSDKVKILIQGGIHFLFKNYRLSTGAFIHSVDANGSPQETQNELYTQAFVLFSLARAYAILKDTDIKKSAKNLLFYLQENRRNKNGGFTELKAKSTVFQSNPHMHLFEAALEWLKVDPDDDWKNLASDLHDLSTQKFIINPSHLMAEHFNQDWKPLGLKEGSEDVFIFEPGHHYEWAWLFLQYEKLAGIDLGQVAQQLFTLADHHGINRKTNLALDEVRSDFKIEKASSRFWPQCERIKAAVELGLKALPGTQISYAIASDEAMTALFNYFGTTRKGLWFDSFTEAGFFISQPAKASSLYHIINAISEYCSKRPQLQD